MKIINISHLKKYLLCDKYSINVDKIKGYIANVYRSPGQGSLAFRCFPSDFEELLTQIESFKPNIIVFLIDCNAPSNSWWGFDANTSEGT